MHLCRWVRSRPSHVPRCVPCSGTKCEPCMPNALGKNGHPPAFDGFEDKSQPTPLSMPKPPKGLRGFIFFFFFFFQISKQKCRATRRPPGTSFTFKPAKSAIISEFGACICGSQIQIKLACDRFAAFKFRLRFRTEFFFVLRKQFFPHCDFPVRVARFVFFK